jgi:uncharacterized membrane protein/plastocyanin
MIFFALLIVSSAIVRVFLRNRDKALRDSARISLGAAFAIAGLTHLLSPNHFVQHMPEWVPGRHAVVYASGGLEMLRVVALAVSRRHAQAIAILIGHCLVAVFAPSVYVAVAGVDVDGKRGAIYPWFRLPFQALYILWVLASAGVRRSNLARISIKRVSLAALAAVALVGCSSNSASLSDASTTAGAEERIVVVMEDASFKTEEITLTEGRKTTIEVVNNDSMPHDFAIDSLDLNSGTVEPGQTVVMPVVATRDASEFVCTFHSGMKGRINMVTG